MVEHQLPKLDRRVRFPLPALCFCKKHVMGIERQDRGAKRRENDPVGRLSRSPA